MEYVSSKAIAEKWGVTVRAVQLMCVQGKIKRAKKLEYGRVWLIPSNAERPIRGSNKRGNNKTKANIVNNLVENEGTEIKKD